MDKNILGELVKNIGLGIFIVGLLLSSHNLIKSLIVSCLGIIVMGVGIVIKNR